MTVTRKRLYAMCSCGKLGEITSPSGIPQGWRKYRLRCLFNTTAGIGSTCDSEKYMCDECKNITDARIEIITKRG